MADALEKKYSSQSGVPKKDLVSIKADQPALEALKILSDARILGAPVMDGSGLVGLLDLVDLSAYALDVFKQLSAAPQKEEDEKRTWRILFDAALKLKKAKELVNYSKANYSYPAPEGATLRQILDALSARGVHRVPLLNSKGAITRLVTQSEVLRFIASHLDDFGPSLDKSVLLAGLVGKGTVYVKDSQPVLDAFSAITEKKVSAVAVIDGEGRLVGNVSVRDLRLVLRDKIDLQLQKPIKQFLEEVKEGRPSLVAVAVLPGDSVRSAITRMTSNGIHRVYVVDGQQHTQGVISITDVFTYLLRASFAAEASEPAHIAEEKAQKAAALEAVKQSPEVKKPVPKDSHLTVLDDAFQIMFPSFTNDEELFYVLGDAAGEEVVTRLRKHNVMCLPVIDPIKRSDNKLRVQGLVDVADVAAFVLEFGRDRTNGEAVVFEDLHVKRLKGRSAKDLINYNGTNGCAILGIQTRLMDVFNALTIPGVHRVPSLAAKADSKHALGRFITQTQVLKFVATNIQLFGSVLDTTIVNARCGVFQPKYVKDTQTALQGFQVLFKEKVSGLPVVNAKFQVVGSLSTSDLRLVVLTRPALNLNKPITEFWQDVQEDPSYVHPSRAITVAYSDSVRTVITRMHSNQVHRLFIVTENQELLGVVSLSDVLKYILRAGSAY